jgi:hypothetical protein
MGVVNAIYHFFAHAPAGSTANHLSHSLLAATITLIIILLLAIPFGLRSAAFIGAITGAAIFVGRAQAQAEHLLSPAPWWHSWIVTNWQWDQIAGALYPIVSSVLIYGFVVWLTSRAGIRIRVRRISVS